MRRTTWSAGYGCDLPGRRSRHPTTRSHDRRRHRHDGPVPSPAAAAADAGRSFDAADRRTDDDDDRR